MSCASIGRMLKIITTCIDKKANNELSRVNLTRTQMEMLVFIFFYTKDGKEINQVDIEKEFNLKNPTVTGIINRLENKGYIIRRKSEKDKRYKKIEITETGKELVIKGKNKMDKREEELLNFLTDDEKKELDRLLNKIIENI